MSTTADIVADDGACSLREAITAANTNSAFHDCPAGEAAPTIDQIQLPWGVYRLTLPGAGEDANAGGDLDIHESVRIEGAGVADFDPQHVALFPVSPAFLGIPVIENRLGVDDPSVAGDRVIHVPNSGPPVRLGLKNVAVTGGRLTCTTTFCQGGSAGIYAEGSGELDFDGVLLANNEQYCSGFECGTGSAADFASASAALSSTPDFTVDIENSAIVDNRASCTGTNCNVGKVVDVEALNLDVNVHGSVIHRNEVSCDGQGARCDVDEVFDVIANRVRLSDSSFVDNRAHCSGADCDTDDVIEIDGKVVIPGEFTCSVESMEFTGNTATCHGESCDTDSVIEFRCDDGGQFQEIDVLANYATCVGIDCDTDELFDLDAGLHLSVEDTRVEGNLLRCEGESCDVDELVEFSASGPLGALDVVISGDVSIRHNAVTCSGTECDLDSIARFAAAVQTLSDIEVSSNVVLCAGLRCASAGGLAVWSDVSATIERIQAEWNQFTCLGTDCSHASSCSASVPVCSRGTGSALFTSGETQLSDALVANNHSTGFGAGISHNDSLQITNSAIIFNRATGGGGGIYNGRLFVDGSHEAGQLTVQDSQVNSNHAASTGGAIMNPAGASLAVLGSTVQLNTGLGGGGGIYNQGTVSDLSSSTLSWNFPWFSDCINASGGVGCP